MSDIAIWVERLGKRYRIGRRKTYLTLRDALARSWKSAFGLFGGKTKLETQSANNYIWALKDVSFEVKQGEVVGIIGRNGAGKSTLLKILSRITKPTEGYAEIHGRVGSLLEVGTGFHPELTGRENIHLNGAILGMKKKEIDKKFDEIVAFAEVEKFIDTPVKYYSSGMYMRLAFAVAAHLESEVLLVDEVLAVGDAAFQKKCLGKMGDVAKEGRTVLFVSHNMRAIQALCPWGMLLDNSQISRVGPIQEVVNTYMSDIYERVHSTKDAFPVFNQLYGVGITHCITTVELDNNNAFMLRVELGVQSTAQLRNIGVGLALTYMDGTRVSVLGPSVTNYVIHEINGYRRCIFYCREVNKYLAGGDYLLSVWLAKPGVKYIVKVEEAALITIPSRDIFLSGRLFKAHRNGLVPLPVQFEIQ